MQEKLPAPEGRDRPTGTNSAPAGHKQEYESRLSGRTGLVFTMPCKNVPGTIAVGFAPVAKRYPVVAF